MFLLRAICFAAPFLVLPAVGSATAQDEDSNREGCIVYTLKGWEKQPVRWIGGCKDAYADGLGVLNRYEDGKVVESFYGRMENGSTKLGVIDSSTGYIAGKFKNGEPEPFNDRDSIIKAFETASLAASGLSNLYGREGNKTSAQFYKDQAEKLAQQMD